jgi:hypothetical protein
MAFRQVINDGLFNIPKALLTFSLKIFPYRAAESLLNDFIGVDEGKLKPSGKLTPDGGFTGTGEAD